MYGSYTTKGKSENDGHGRYSNYLGKFKLKNKTKIIINKKKMSDETKKKVKKAIILGTAFTGTALLTIGGIYVYKHKDILDKEIKLGRKNVNFIRRKNVKIYIK